MAKNAPAAPFLSGGAWKALKGALSPLTIPVKFQALLVMVCGAADSPDSAPPTKRQEFLLYASRHATDIRLFRAESVIEALETKKGHFDLLTLENQLAGLADCVVVLVESAGSLVELGAFSNYKSLQKVLLPVLDQRYAHDKSFIREGPVALLEKKSDFRPPIFLDFDRFLLQADILVKRIASRRRTKVEVRVASREEFTELPTMAKLYVLEYIVRLLMPVRLADLVAALEFVFGRGSFNIHRELALLVAMRIVERSGEFYFWRPGAVGSVAIEAVPGLHSVRAAVMASYSKMGGGRLDVLAKLVQGEAG